eukprot:272758-Pyramimonas_sp.AAC.1
MSAALASSVDIQKQLAKSVGRYSGTTPARAANVGVDFRAGQKRSKDINNAKLRDRFKKLKERPPTLEPYIELEQIR